MVIRCGSVDVETSMPRVKPIRHDDQLSVVGHLDELRSRLVISAITYFVAFSLCVWQSDLILQIVNAPLPNGLDPITLGPAEPFTATLKNAGYAALLLTLPVLLYEAYAFLLPAFSPRERRMALPLMLMVPVLFIGGVLFAYFVVLTPALHFLLNFNASEFNTQIRAADYYSFVTLLMAAMGIGFQVPVGVLVISRLGLVSVDQLRRSRRYAIVVIAALAALLPTLDPVTLMLEMLPMIALYEVGIQMARFFAPTPGASLASDGA
jgi:sec-independent protein translocase protein TatC